MATITTRTTKGSAITNLEADQNFTNLNTEVTVDNFPQARASLNLDFTKPVLNPLVSFQRAGVATRTNQTGLVEQVVANQPRFDYDAVTKEPKGLLIEEQRTNLLEYSEDLNFWTLQNTTISPNTVVSPTGNTNADTLIESATVNTQHLISRGIGTAVSGSTYTFSCFVKNAVGTRKLILTAFGEGYSVFDPITGSITETGNNVCSAVNCGNGWWRFSAAITKTNTNANFYMGFWSTINNYTGDGTSAFYLYGAQVELGTFATSYVPSTNAFTSRASSATYYDSTGTLQTAASGAQRVQYNPDNLAAQPYLLLEPASTNFVRNDFATFNGGTVSSGTAVAPDGSTARKFVLNAGVVSFPTLGNPSNNSTTFSIVQNATVDVAYTGYFAATGTLNYKPSITLELSTGNATNRLYCQYRLNLALGTIESSSTPSPCSILTAATLTRQAKGMYKFFVVVRYTQDATARDTVGAYIQCYNEASVQSGYTADGVSGFQAALLQCELSSYPTSYIPTTTAAATRAADASSSTQTTRNADQVSIQNLVPWYNRTQGTMYAEFIGTVVGTAQYPAVFAIRPAGDAGSATTIEMFLNTGTIAGLVRIPFLTDQAGLSFAITIAATNKAALAYKSNDAAMAVNAGTVFTDTSVVLPEGLAQARIGYNISNAYLNGCVKRIMYYPTRLSNVQLQALTG